MKKLVSILLSLMMVMCFMPSLAFATTDNAIDANTTVTISDLTYTGQVLVPAVTVTDGEDSLTENTQYTISCSPSEIKEPGTYTATISGAGVITGSTTKTFKVVKKLAVDANSVSNVYAATVGAISPVTYTGAEIKPAVTVTESGNTLVNGTDYEVAYTDNINASISAKATIKFKGKYSGTIEKTFTITAASLGSTTADTFSVATSATDETIKNEIKKVLKLNGNSITETNYNVGTIPTHSTAKTTPYEVTLTAKGSNFTAGTTKVIKFYAGTDLSNATINPTTATYTYNGSEQKWTGFTVSVNGSPVPPSGYEVTYANNKDVTSSAQLTIKGKLPYFGTKTFTYNISAKDITNNVTWENLGTVVAGSSPSPKVVCAGRTLVADTDYDITYDRTSASIIKVKIQGKNNYYGNAETTYPVGKDISSYIYSATIYPASYEYTGSIIKPTMSIIPVGGTTLREGYEYSISYNDVLNVGNRKIIIKGIGSYAGTKEIPVQVTARTIKLADITLSSKNFTYDGTAKRPTVSVYSGGRTLYLGTDYTVTYPTAVNPGSYNITVSGRGNYIGYVTVPFTIGGTDISTCTASLSPTSYNYTGYACSPTVTVKKGNTVLKSGTDYTVTYQNNTFAGTATAVITGKGMYSGTLKLTYSIKGKANSVDLTYVKYTKYLTSDPFRIYPTSAGDQTGFSYTSSDSTVATVSNIGLVKIVGTGKATITVSTVGTKSYNPASETINITVKPSKATPKLYSESKGKLKVRVTKKTGITGYQIRYGRAGVYKYSYMTYANNSYTTQSKTMKSLKSGYKYFVKVRPYKLATDGTRVYGNWSSTKSIKIR